MKMYRLIILSAILLQSCGTKSTQQQPEQKTSDDTEWVLDKVDSSILIFKNGQVFNTKLFNLNYIGQIPVENKAPYLIFSGVDCNECDANVAIYIHSPSDGELSVKHGQNRYSYPGKETDYITDSLLYECRAFYGQVLKRIKGVIWYQKTLMEDGSWKISVFLVDVSGKTKADTLLNDTGQLKETISLVSSGLCKEIIGTTYSSEP